ncbi:MAG: amino acid ABC transporter permease [Clostridia bacterium]|nr:amino acid ABC transporter permease [Clostridia bacterium]
MTFAEKIAKLWSLRGLFAESLGYSLLIALGAVVLGFIIGVILAVIRIAPKKNPVMKALDAVALTYITVIRGTPTLVQLLILYNSVLVSFKRMPTNLLVPIIAFGINSGAYMAEIIRSGISSVDPGQTEAGRSLGLSWITTMKKIVIPQAIKTVVPAIFNEIIILVKETSVVSYIVLKVNSTQKWDLLGMAEKQGLATPACYLVFLFCAALLYLAVVMLLTLLQHVIEKRLKKNER